MATEKHSEVNTNKAEISGTPLIHPPLISSHQANWSGISLEHYLYPAYETSEYSLEHHEICIYVGQPLRYEQIIEGRLRSHNCIYGDMVIYPAGLTQKLSWNKEAEFIQIGLQPEFLTRTGEDWLNTNKIEILPQFKLRDPLLQQLALVLVGELNNGGRNNNLYAESMLQAFCVHLLTNYSFCVHLLTNYSATKPSIPDRYSGLPAHKLRHLIEYIHERLEQNITLQEMSEVVNLSPSHLTRLFKQSKGISLYQYVIRCRIDRAQQLLKQKRWSIAEVANRVGFNDQSHLTHHFKRHVGTTPKKFLQQ